MKVKLLLITGLLLIAHTGFSQKMAAKNYDIKDYESINVGSALDVRLIPDGKEGVTVQCDERLLPAVAVHQEGDVLDIRLDWKAIDRICGRGFFGRNSRNISISKNKVKINGKTFSGGIRIAVHVKRLRHLSARSSGDITWNGDIVTDRIVLKTSSSGDITWNGTLQADDLEIQCSSSGDVEGNCIGKQVNIRLSSSGDFEGNITAGTLKARLSSSGDLEGKINAETARFDLSSSADANVNGRINYLIVNAGSSSDFHGRRITYDKAEVKTSSSANIYLSKTGEVIDLTERRTGVHFD